MRNMNKDEIKGIIMMILIAVVVGGFLLGLLYLVLTINVQNATVNAMSKGFIKLIKGAHYECY